MHPFLYRAGEPYPIFPLRKVYQKRKVALDGSGSWTAETITTYIPKVGEPISLSEFAFNPDIPPESQPEEKTSSRVE